MKKVSSTRRYRVLRAADEALLVSAVTEWAFVDYRSGALRRILGGYLLEAPERLAFAYSASGKPRLAEPWATSPLQFNLAHSDGTALLAVTSGRAIGIDLEQMRPLPDAEEMARRFFAPREVDVFRSVAPGDRLRAFYACWTRKEAFLKATGEGLARPLDEFEVALAPGQPARLLRVLADPGEVLRWSLRDVSANEELIAAVAVEGPIGRIVCYDVERLL
jgi:4'-phosphopantetheinyl transferase